MSLKSFRANGDHKLRMSRENKEDTYSEEADKPPSFRGFFHELKTLPPHSYKQEGIRLFCGSRLFYGSIVKRREFVKVMLGIVQ